MTIVGKNRCAAEALGRVDEAIIEVLRLNGRVTFKKLASQVHLSESACQQRVRKLERLGVIRGYGAFIDPDRIAPGLSLLVLLTLDENKGFTAQRNFEACIGACPQIVECRLISGTLDYSLRMRCRDMQHFRLLTEPWLENSEYCIKKLEAYPELAVIKNVSAHQGTE